MGKEEVGLFGFWGMIGGCPVKMLINPDNVQEQEKIKFSDLLLGHGIKIVRIEKTGVTVFFLFDLGFD